MELLEIFHPYNSLVFSVLTYGTETWNSTELDKEKLDKFQNRPARYLRRMLRIREDLQWRATPKNGNIKSQRDKIANRKLGWISHVLRMDNIMICKTALTWHPEGRRKIDRPKATWRRTTEQEQSLVGIVGRWQEQ